MPRHNGKYPGGEFGGELREDLGGNLGGKLGSWARSLVGSWAGGCWVGSWKRLEGLGRKTNEWNKALEENVKDSQEESELNLEELVLLI